MIYFDNAATGMPKNPAAIKAMTEAMLKCGNPGRGGHPYSVEAAETVYNCRKKLAAMFGSRPDLVIFTSGATEALNIAIKGANRRGGLTVVSSMEHNSVIRPLNVLRRRGETSLRQFRVDIESDADTLENFAAVTRGASNIVVTHASNVCGRVLPIKEMRALAPEDAVFILDASQTAGHIPVSVTELGADVICLPAHKGLCGPMGVGALIINPESGVYLDSLIEGGTGTNSKSPDMPDQYPEHLESGTQNVAGIAGLSAALDGFAYPVRERRVFAYLLRAMRLLPGITLHGAPEPGKEEAFMPLILFNQTGADCETLAEKLAEAGFALRAGYHCSPAAHRTLGTYETGGVRLSLGEGNTLREAERFIAALAALTEAPDDSK
ncbi:MAG: aminotransferase class V-fold PLP-dependent enzyme [Clostridia bacterium]|nr:aminotransferase class V-fold PLP-dependent enzyme [Clostridia bacterium]